MASNPGEPSPPQSYRSDEQWVSDLSGKNGDLAQGKAYQDLSKYLYAVVYRYLAKRAVSGHVLATFSPQELGELAEDFVQDVIEKMARNNHALLNQFSGAGSFTSWAAQIAKRTAATELRRPFWTRRKRAGSGEGESLLEENGSHSEQHTEAQNAPEAELEQKELRNAIQDCRDAMSERYRVVYDHLIVELKSAEELADDLGISVNAVYMLVFRVKRSMRKCLSKKGYGSET